MLLFGFNGLAQQRTVSGKVTGTDGLAIPGVNVLVVGTRIGTTTNDRGEYTLNVPDGSTRISFSYLGFDEQVKNITAGVLDVKLLASNKTLGEIVITGYTSQVRARSTISSATISSKNIENQPQPNINDILQGKATGLTVTSTSGQPGAASDVRVRGAGSIGASSQPLYVIDGITIERGQFARDGVGIGQNNDILSNINPNDIESVNVLKDASALALYGSRGANGVILITTKKGSSGGSKINFSAQVGTTKPNFGNFELMDGQQTYNYERSVLAVNGSTPAEIDAQYPRSMLDKTFNWQDAAFRNGNSQTYDLSIRGGNDKTVHSFSLGYFDQDGTVIESNFKRFSSLINVDTKARDWLSAGLSVNASVSGSQNADGGSFYSSPIFSSIGNSPLHVYPYKDDGTLFTGQEAEYGGFSGDNFLYSTPLNYSNLKQFRGLGKIYADAKVTSWLHLKQTAAVDLINAGVKTFLDPTTGNGTGATPDKSGQLNQTSTNAYTFTSQSSLYGSFKMGQQHEFDYLAMMEYQRYNSSFIMADGLGVADPQLQELGTFGTPNGVGGGQSEYAFLSYLGQLNYTLAGKYTLSASFRRDGSSRFGTANRYANFYAFGGSWKILQESFMKDQRVFSDLRLRASYGTSGVAEFGNYVARSLYTYSGVSYNGTAGSRPSTPGNTELTWEVNKQLDLGLEFGVFKGALSGTVDLYRRVGNDLLQNVPVSRTSGFSTAQRNVGSVENKGLEVSLTSLNFKKLGGFNWSTTANFSYNTNKVLQLYSGQDIINGTLGITREGYALNSWFLPVWAGVDPANGDPQWFLADGVTKTNSYAVASRNQNRKIVGSALPKYTIGLNNSFSYKGIDLSFLMFASLGGKIYNQTRSNIESDGRTWGFGVGANAGKNFWTTPGQQADLPKPVIGGNKNSASASSRWIESNDFLRMRTVTFGYSLPSNLAAKMKVQGMRVFVNAINPFTITNYQGVDPEGAIGGNDVFKYPVGKSISAGVNISL